MSKERPQFTHWRSDGKAKVGLTEAKAFAEARRISDEDLDNGILGRFMCAYPCGECSDWHVGNLRRMYDTNPPPTPPASAKGEE